MTDAKNKASHSLFNIDGWKNLLSNIGTSKSQIENTSFSRDLKLDRETCGALYENTAMAKRIIDLPAYEMTRQWINIENDTDGVILKNLKRLGAKQVFRDWIKWGNLFGGAIIVMGIDDGGDLEQPVNETGIRKVNFLRVYDRYQVSWTTTEINDNPESEYFGEVEYYTVNAYHGGKSFKVHRSRILKYDGADVPERTKIRNSGWGDSFLQALYRELKNNGVIIESVVSIVQDFVQTIIQIENLQNLIASGKEDLVKKRLDLIDLSRSVNNTIMLDGEESYTKQASTVTGLEGLMDKYMLSLSAASGIPFTKLFGESPKGLNSTGDADIRNYYDEIKSKQEDILLPGLERLKYLIEISRDEAFKGKGIPDGMEIEFNALWQMTDKEEAEYRKINAETDDIYITAGVLSAKEVTESRFENGYSPDTQINKAERREPPKDDPKDKK